METQADEAELTASRTWEGLSTPVIFREAQKRHGKAIKLENRAAIEELEERQDEVNPHSCWWKTKHKVSLHIGHTLNL